MHVARAGALIMTVALVAACSGDDDAAPTTTVAPPVTIASTAPATTAATTTVAPTTAITVAQTVPSTTPEPTTPPATIPADIEQVKQDVIAAATASWDAYQQAIRSPLDEARLARLPEVMTGPLLERSVQEIAQFATGGIVAVENPTTPSSITFFDDSFVVDPAAGTASIEYCRVGSDLGIEPGGNPDGTDKIVVNEVNAYHERTNLVFVDGRWLDNDGVSLQKYPGTTQCAVA